MKTVIYKSIRLILGLFLFALGIVMTINANIGLQPWDIFHQGLSKVIHMTMGQTSILVGLVIVIFNIFMKEKARWGTLGNMVLIGLFMDFLMLNNLIPEANHFVVGILMMLAGLFVIGIASYFYIGTGWGTGPRDGLMVVFIKKTGKSVRFVRNTIEITASVAGYFLGGSIGIGTVITATTIGYFVQFAFKLFNFNVEEVQHRYIDDDLRFLYKKIKTHKKKEKELME